MKRIAFVWEGHILETWSSNGVVWAIFMRLTVCRGPGECRADLDGDASGIQVPLALTLCNTNRLSRMQA